LVNIVRNLFHLTNEDLVIARIGYRSIETGEYLGSIANHQTAEVFLKYFHTVFIDQLQSCHQLLMHQW
jgi:hypothetical protein